MTLADLTLPIDLETARGLALVFSPALAARLGELHAVHGSPNLVPVPRVLTDGRLMLGADILTETRPGGLLAAMWQNSDHAAIAAGVTVMTMDEAAALLPVEGYA
jgi:hypothetical protein